MSTFDEIDRRLEQLPGVLARELRVAMTASLSLIEVEARQNAARDTRAMAEGKWTNEVRGSGMELIGVVGPTLHYARYVELGRRAGAKAPPVDALMGWVRRHPHGRGSVRSQAFVLARAIKRRGIRPRPFLRPAYQHNRAAIRALFQRAGARVVAHLRGGAL